MRKIIFYLLCLTFISCKTNNVVEEQSVAIVDTSSFEMADSSISVQEIGVDSTSVEVVNKTIKKKKIKPLPPKIESSSSKSDESFDPIIEPTPIEEIKTVSSEVVESPSGSPNIEEVSPVRTPIIVNKQRELKKGKVVYTIPKVMKVRETYQVILRISENQIVIYDGLPTENRVEAVIPITETMEVRLVDPSPTDNPFFNIVGDNTGIQLVDSLDNYTQWTWNVTPIRYGESKLKIVVSIIRNGIKKETVYEGDVIVKVNPTAQVKYWISNYWQWLLTTLIIPIFGWWWNRKKKRKSNKKV
jgi:hypothetical protein